MTNKQKAIDSLMMKCEENKITFNCDFEINKANGFVMKNILHFTFQKAYIKNVYSIPAPIFERNYKEIIKTILKTLNHE